MSTNGMENWAVDLAEVGAVYPFQGGEGLFVAIGVAFWIGWHILQFRMEAAELDQDMQADASGDRTRQEIDDY